MRSWSEFNKREKIGIIVIGVLLVVIPSFYLYRNKAQTVEQINRDLDTTISRIKDNENVLRRKEELKTEYQTALTELENKEQDQPIKLSQKGDLIVRLNEIVDKTKVELKTLELGKINSRNQETNDQYSYQQVPITVEVSGEYSNILKLVNEIEKLKYLIKIDNLNLNSNLQKALKAQAKADISVQIKLVAFATTDEEGR